MSLERTEEYLISLVHELRKLPQETEWVEFKKNQAEPEVIGEYISALSNSAALLGRSSGYVIWGIEDGTHNIVGTTFQPFRLKIGNEEFENWLLHLLSPKIHFRFFSVVVDDLPLVLLEISRAFRHPVQFHGQEYIRVGSYKKRLRDHPEKEGALWRSFDNTPFEGGVALGEVTASEVLSRLDYPAYFDLLGLPLPDSHTGITDALSAEQLIRKSDSGKWHITNLGAILFAKRLADFDALRRKAVRVIVYKGNSRVVTERETTGTRGYASGFVGLVAFIDGLVPTNEILGKALRKSVPMYPQIAIRELVANALIHQDFSPTGAGPMVELFEDRIEISNPGIPLVQTDRFLDSPPRSRNEAMASLMRRIGVCEERGSGVDKVVFEMEYAQLPAPIFEVAGENTRATLLSHRPLTKMDRADRIRACYLHACLRYVTRHYMTNASLRERFGIDERNSATASRLIKEAQEAKMIRQYDETSGRRFMKYVPFWA